jgi:hypothetical protein
MERAEQSGPFLNLVDQQVERCDDPGCALVFRRKRRFKLTPSQKEKFGSFPYQTARTKLKPRILCQQSRSRHSPKLDPRYVL